MKKIVFLNGVGTSGKGEFVNICRNLLYVEEYSVVDKVKEASKILGWDGSKSEKNRLFLSNMKLLSVKFLDHSFLYVSDMINVFLKDEFISHQFNQSIIFIDSREPKELFRFRNNFDCVCVLVRNNRVSPITSNMADANVGNFDYDYYIDNNGTLQDLENEANKFIKWLFEEK